MAKKQPPPKFFVPGIEDAKEAEKILEAVAKHVKAPLPKKGERIFALGWAMNSEDKLYAVVGEPLERHLDGEDVMAILPDNGRFHICTANHGVLGGAPLTIEPYQTPSYVRFSA